MVKQTQGISMQRLDREPGTHIYSSIFSKHIWSQILCPPVFFGSIQSEGLIGGDHPIFSDEDNPHPPHFPLSLSCCQIATLRQELAASKRQESLALAQADGLKREVSRRPCRRGRLQPNVMHKAKLPPEHREIIVRCSLSRLRLLGVRGAV